MALNLKIWYDKEADFLEVNFSDKAGYMRETDNDYIMERIDEQGNILGFFVMEVSHLSTEKPLIAELVGKIEDSGTGFLQ